MCETQDVRYDGTFHRVTITPSCFGTPSQLHVFADLFATRTTEGQYLDGAPNIGFEGPVPRPATVSARTASGPALEERALPAPAERVTPR